MYERRTFSQSDHVSLDADLLYNALVNEPVYESPNYTCCLVDETVDGDIIYQDMTVILKDVDKYVSQLGQSVVNDFIASIRPTPPTLQDNMTDEQRLDVCISRHCQTIAERQQVLQYLQSEHSDLLSQLQMGEQQQNPLGLQPDSAPVVSSNE